MRNGNDQVVTSWYQLPHRKTQKYKQNVNRSENNKPVGFLLAMLSLCGSLVSSFFVADIVRGLPSEEKSYSGQLEASPECQVPSFYDIPARFLFPSEFILWHPISNTCIGTVLLSHFVQTHLFRLFLPELDENDPGHIWACQISEPLSDNLLANQLVKILRTKQWELEVSVSLALFPTLYCHETNDFLTTRKKFILKDLLHRGSAGWIWA